MKYFSYALLGLILLCSAKTDKKYYNEKYRPQVHFSPEKNWLFESNGLVFYKGNYHLFYKNVSISNKVFDSRIGHATSRDLIHWEHLPSAFSPDDKATDINSCRPMSGSAVIDSMNLTGLQSADNKAMLIFYSDSQGNQNLAYSTDKGATWKKYEKNPVISDPGEDSHDPKVFYHQSSGKWVLALYRAKGEMGKKAGISLYTSSNLLNWEYKSHLEGYGECPDLFEVGFEAPSKERKWVITSGEGGYKIGVFDGTTFLPETEMRKMDYGKNFFAAQTVSNAPDGKVIQLAWMRGGEYPDMAFNGQLTFPSELFLRSTKKGPVLCRKPIESIKILFDKDLVKKGKNIIPGLKGNLLSGIKGDVIYLKAVLLPKSADSFGILVRNGKKSNGTDIQYDTAKKTLDVNGSKMIMEQIDGKIVLEIILDRSSVEVYGNHGETGITTCFSPLEGEDELLLYAQGGELFVESLEAYTLKSAWSNK